MDPFHGCGCDNSGPDENVTELWILQVWVGVQEGFLIHDGIVYQDSDGCTHFSRDPGSPYGVVIGMMLMMTVQDWLTREWP